MTSSLTIAVTTYGHEESSDKDITDPNLKKADQQIKEWVAQEDTPADPEYQDHEEVADSLDPESPPGSPRAPFIMDPDKDDEDLEDIVEPITSEDLDLLDNEGDVERPTLEESAAGPSSTSSLPTLNLPSTSRASPDMFADLDTDSSLIPPPPVVIPVSGSGVRKRGRPNVASNTHFGDLERPSNKKKGKGKSWTVEFDSNSEQEWKESAMYEEIQDSFNIHCTRDAYKELKCGKGERLGYNSCEVKAKVYKKANGGCKVMMPEPRPPHTCGEVDMSKRKNCDYIPIKKSL